MNRPASLLWFEGMDPQCLSELAALQFFITHGCDLQLEPVPIVEREQCRFQLETGLGPGQFGRFDAFRVDNYQVHATTGLPSGAVERTLPDVIRKQGKQALSLEIWRAADLEDYFLHDYDFSLIRVREADRLPLSELEQIVQDWLTQLPALAQRFVLTDVYAPPVKAYVNINDFLREAGLLKRKDEQTISWSETLAYGVGNGQLWLNMRGREAEGVVRPGREECRVAELLKKELLLHWRDPATDEPIVERVLAKEELYQGEYLFKAPDFTIVYRPGYAPSPRAKQLLFDGCSVQPQRPEQSNRGEQRAYARLLAQGSALKEGISASASLLDLFPSVLYVLGISLPTRLSGKVLSELFSEAQLALAPVEYTRREEESLSCEDTRSILNRLRELGYLG